MSHYESGLSTATGYNSDGSIIPGTILSRLVISYAELLNQSADSDDALDITRTYKANLFRDIIDYLRTYCVPNLSQIAYDKLTEALPLLFNSIVTRQQIKKTRGSTIGSHQPCLHDATEAATALKFDDVRLSKVHDNVRLLFEGAMLILFYILEYAGHEYNVQFFNSFDQVSEKYTRVKRYGEEISYSKDRFPDKGLDLNEQIKLIHFSNLIKISLLLIPNIKKGNRTHIVQLCARVVEGPSAKYISGSGMAPATRRRFTVYEDESEVMPEPKAVRIAEVVKILNSNDPNTGFNEVIVGSKLNVSSNEISSFQWQNGGFIVEAQEISSNNGKTVIRQTQVSRNAIPVAYNVNYSMRQESPRDKAKDPIGGGSQISHQPVLSNNHITPVVQSALPFEIEDTVDYSEDFSDVLDFDANFINVDNDIKFNTETKEDEDGIIRTVSLTKTITQDPADVQALKSVEDDINYFIDSFYKIKPGDDLIETTMVTSLNNETSRLKDSTKGYVPLSGLTRTFSNKLSKSNLNRADSCLKEFIFRGVSCNDVDSDFHYRSNSNNQESRDDDQPFRRSTSQWMSLFFENPSHEVFDFGHISSDTSLHTARLNSDSATSGLSSRSSSNTSKRDRSSSCDSILQRIITECSTDSISPNSTTSNSDPSPTSLPPSKHMRNDSEELPN